MRLIDETPRELLQEESQADLDGAKSDNLEQEPFRIVSAEFKLDVVMDPKVIITGVAEVSAYTNSASTFSSE